ncbi:DUF6282 family protein [Sphingopyxis flava]|uniref:Phosphotriesterase family protein n=1 Tax=Sphingopyxis flava TaxID=1507287 RepID=A0A1T5FN34_9SPHN|nr:DUF6282 family protein [Sphingopyxis flava]SKB97581.1 Phosphotriesterase family protein [Sphingopyxis flava]
MPSAADRALLKDAIDIHAHLDPDSFGPSSAQAARALDVIDMAYRAKRAGMTGFVIKQHYDQTAQLAQITSKVVPGVEAYGMLALNRTVGGLNPEAIRHFAEIEGGRARIVSMPTWDSENNISQSTSPNRVFVPVSRNGELLPEAVEVIQAVAAAKIRDSSASLALSTGHLSAAEALLVVREAKKQGITRIVVTHAMGHPIDMSIPQMKEAARLGAYIEFVAGFIIGKRAKFTTQQYFDAVRAIGADHVIVSSDAGQLNRPFPDDAIAFAAGELRAKGITEAELRKMLVENPRKLLGIQ